MSQYSAFTILASSILTKLVIDAGICNATAEPVEDDMLLPIKALVDIGRAKTVISPQLMVKLMLEGDVDYQMKPVPVDIYLPNRIRIAGIPMEMTPLEEGVDCCLGMDVISLGDVSLSSLAGKTQFSFRVPAQGGSDFVEMHNASTATLTTKSKKAVVVAGRDAKCPCGSGKKHKNCCAKLH